MRKEGVRGEVEDREVSYMFSQSYHYGTQELHVCVPKEVHQWFETKAIDVQCPTAVLATEELSNGPIICNQPENHSTKSASSMLLIIYKSVDSA